MWDKPERSNYYFIAAEPASYWLNYRHIHILLSSVLYFES